jgi:hypothetical protein
MVGVGHMNGALLVHHRKRLDLPSAIQQSIEQGDVPVTRNAHQVRHALADQVFDNNLCACQSHLLPLSC